MTVFVPAIRVFLSRGKPVQFDIAASILEIAYRQALFWFGAIYAPIVPLVSSITVFVIFYLKKWSLLRFSAPPRRIYSSFTQRIYFLLFLLATLTLMALPIGYTMTGYCVMDSHWGGQPHL
jgi:hypothetical protein